MKTWDSVSLINLPSLFSNGNKNVKGLQTSVFVHILWLSLSNFFLNQEAEPKKDE